MNNGLENQLVNRRVSYTLEIEGKFYIVKNVPARVGEETGEQFFAPSTVERLQEIVLGQAEPNKVFETPVYEYAD